MKVLIVGNGAREHAIGARLAQDCELYAVMSRKNPALAQLSKEYWVCDIENPADVARAISGRSFDLGFASPDAALAAGITDVIEKGGTMVASPSRAAARIEWDKAYMRALLQRHRIRGSPRHVHAEDGITARQAMKELGDVAIKPLGLTGGKGVRVSGDHFGDEAEGLSYAESLIKKDGSVLIEEKLIGEEFTLQAFCDGTRAVAMPPVQAHKRAYEGDKGPNTGGMGSYSSGPLLPFMESGDLDEAKSIMQGVVHAMKKDGTPFRGVLYGQFMVTPHGVRVIEFNARFGDPEAMNVIALLQDSLTDTFLSMAEGQLRAPPFSTESTVVKYLVPEGYPDNPRKDAEVQVDSSAIERSGASIFYASVYESKGKICTSGSRAFGILGKAGSLEEAERMAEEGCKGVSGPLWHRKDIGTRQLIDGKAARMRSLRGR